MDLQTIAGKWKVVPESGRVPRGLRVTVKPRTTKAAGSGWAKLGRLPVGRFHIAGSTLEHGILPLAEQLQYRDDGSWHGRLLWRGKELGLFRLERIG